MLLESAFKLALVTFLAEAAVAGRTSVAARATIAVTARTRVRMPAR
jgi:hypothetical protein